jgi:hypothetical protein
MCTEDDYSYGMYLSVDLEPPSVLCNSDITTDYKSLWSVETRRCLIVSFVLKHRLLLLTIIEM